MEGKPTFKIDHRVSVNQLVYRYYVEETVACVEEVESNDVIIFRSADIK